MSKLNSAFGSSDSAVATSSPFEFNITVENAFSSVILNCGSSAFRYFTPSTSFTSLRISITGATASTVFVTVFVAFPLTTAEAVISPSVFVTLTIKDTTFSPSISTFQDTTPSFKVPSSDASTNSVPSGSAADTFIPSTVSLPFIVILYVIVFPGLTRALFVSATASIAASKFAMSAFTPGTCACMPAVSYPTNVSVVSTLSVVVTV